VVEDMGCPKLHHIRHAAEIENLTIYDALPFGMSYVSSIPDPDDIILGLKGNISLRWNNIGPLKSGESTQISLVGRINGAVLGTLTNEVYVSGRLVRGNATCDVQALNSVISVNKTANLTEGAAKTDVNFTLNITNTGEINLTSVKVFDLLPDGMSYISSGTWPPPDNIENNINGTVTVIWNDVGSLGIGESVQVYLVGRIDGDVFGSLTNKVNVVGTPVNGKAVSSNDTERVIARKASINVEKIASPKVGEPLSEITFFINLTNDGNITLKNVTVFDQLPKGMTCILSSTSPQPGINETNSGVSNLTWIEMGPLAVGASKNITLVARIDEDARGALINKVTAVGTPTTGSCVNDTDVATVDLLSINLTKVADKDEVKRGEKIAYNITVCNVGSLPIMDLVLWDVFDHRVEVVSESLSRGSDGR